MQHEFKDLINFNLNVKTLGKSKYNSPLNLSENDGDKIANYIKDDERIFAINSNYELEYLNSKKIKMPSFEKAGPRKNLFFKPGEAVSAIVTCGGLCPGLNAVIRSIVLMNFFRYKNKIIYGIKYGYQGFNKKYFSEVISLNPDFVENIDKLGGTILGSSRGPEDVGVIVDRLKELKVDVLYTIGGDGTLRGASEIYKEIEKRRLPISVISIPKTIDNDISYIDRSFGTETAFSKACDSVNSAHNESKGSYNGIGLVKVMGRMSGFIAANTTLATNNVNFTLIPEVPFELNGPNGFLENLKKRILRKHHAVILAAEGAGQNLFNEKDVKYDASGNKVLGDIGLFLKSKIKEFFEKEKIAVTVRLIDPSYIIRSTEPTPNDALLCLLLAQMAVHAGMAGKTDIVIGNHNGEFIHLPIEVAVSKRKIIDPEGELWLSVLETTGQPMNMINK